MTMHPINELIKPGNGIGGTTDVRKLFEESKTLRTQIDDQPDFIYVAPEEIAKKLGLNKESWKK